MTTSLPRPLPKAAVGVFDSGLGGLSVLRELRRQAPGASVLYLADTANVPYGDKPIEVVRDLALRLTELLVQAGVELVIMASGTSTAAGLEAARAHFCGLPILGTIEPGAQAAVSASSGPIGVLATSATAQSLAFTRAIQRLDPERRVAEQGCPRFVPLVETGRAGTKDAEDAALEYLLPLRRAGVQSIILGCTHFPFLLPSLRRAVHCIGDPAFRPLFVDPSEEAVRQALLLLPAGSPTDSAVHFAASADPESFRRFASLLMGEPIQAVSSFTL